MDKVMVKIDHFVLRFSGKQVKPAESTCEHRVKREVEEALRDHQEILRKHKRS